MKERWTGDLDALLKKRKIRALVLSSRMFYTVDRGKQRGMNYEFFQLFEKYVNKKLRRGKLPVHVVYVPVRRDQLLPDLMEGKGDIAASNLGVTPEREEQLDVSDPVRTDRDEILVEAPGTPSLSSVDELSGLEIYVRKSTSYYEHLELLNERFRAEGKAPVRLRIAPEDLRDEDLVEMVNAGLVDRIIMDSVVAKFWSQLFPRVVLNPDVAVNRGGRTAWFLRKDSPKLLGLVNGFLAKYPEGSLERNMLFQKYLKSVKYVKNAASEAERKKFAQTVELFRKYASKYDLDYLLMMAQGYQESQLDQNAHSRVGAVGIMQLMPATGKEMAVGDIHQVDPNIHAGVKYIRFMEDRYFAHEPMTPMNKALFAFASYNAGPGRVASLRRTAARRGLDPNVWFDNVELVAAEKVGRETVEYVGNIYKYYIAYRLLTEREEERRRVKEELEKTGT